mmetsp:Transcript_6319/g.18811  ORF Transcript_6319/g.18811 Transcript_6319/m.18811 type:complete len:244 (-) Transcript_6319:164-895(-)
MRAAPSRSRTSAGSRAAAIRALLSPSVTIMCAEAPESPRSAAVAARSGRWRSKATRTTILSGRPSRLTIVAMAARIASICASPSTASGGNEARVAARDAGFALVSIASAIPRPYSSSTWITPISLHPKRCTCARMAWAVLSSDGIMRTRYGKRSGSLSAGDVARGATCTTGRMRDATFAIAIVVDEYKGPMKATMPASIRGSMASVDERASRRESSTLATRSLTEQFPRVPNTGNTEAFRPLK